jgi:hypothetical protein
MKYTRTALALKDLKFDSLYGVPTFSEPIPIFNNRKTALMSGLSKICYLAQVGVTNNRTYLELGIIFSMF